MKVACPIVNIAEPSRAQANRQRNTCRASAKNDRKPMVLIVMSTSWDETNISNPMARITWRGCRP